MRVVTKQDKYYSPQQTPPIYQFPKQQNFQRDICLTHVKLVSKQPEIDHPKNIDLEFPRGQVEQDIETNFPYKEEFIEQECSRPTERTLKW